MKTGNLVCSDQAFKMINGKFQLWLTDGSYPLALTGDGLFKLEDEIGSLVVKCVALNLKAFGV